MNLQTLIKRFLKKSKKPVVPTKQITVVDSRSETPSLAPGMTAERILSAIAEAEYGDTRNLFALYRDMIYTDSHLQNEINKRKLAVLGDSMQYLAFEKKQKADEDAAAAVRQELGGFSGWIRVCSALLDSSLYPVSVVEKVFRAVGPRYVIATLIQVPYQLLDFATGQLMIRDTNPANGLPLGSMHEPDPSRYIIHRGHLLSAPDNWGGPMRSVLFWWLLSTMSREWWSRFLEKYGSPFLVGKYHDPEGKSILTQAFSAAVRLGGLVISEDTEVEIKEASAASSGEGYERFISMCNREKSKLVLGQTLSSEAQPTGLGEGTSRMQEEVRQDIRRFDARMLAETLRDQLLRQWCASNRLPGQPPLLVWGAESQSDIEQTTKLFSSLKTAGLRVSDDSLHVLSDRLGLDLERETQPFTPALPFNVPPPVRRRTPPASLDAIAAAAAPALAQALGDAFAPLARIIRESTSPRECERRIRTFFATWDSAPVDTLVANALRAYGANGSSDSVREST